MRKEIFGFEGLYSVTTEGDVYSDERQIIDSVGHKYISKERKLKLTKLSSGYLTVTLRKDNRSYLRYVHRLVAETFIPNPKNLPTVNHVNGDKTDCNVENLEWVTYADNNQHAYENGLHGRGENHYQAKLTEADIRDIRKIGRTKSYEAIAKQYKVSRATIRDIILNRTWKFVK